MVKTIGMVHEYLRTGSIRDNTIEWVFDYNHEITEKLNYE